MIALQTFGLQEKRGSGEELFRHIYRPNDLGSKEGMARIGIRHMAGLPERDRVDFRKALVLVNECQEIMKDSWEELLEEVEKSVKKRMNRFILSLRGA